MLASWNEDWGVNFDVGLLFTVAVLFILVHSVVHAFKGLLFSLHLVDILE